MYESGEHTTAKIAEVLEVSRATLYRHLETSDGGERLDGRPITLRPWIHEPTTMHREVGPIVPGMGKELKKPGEEGGVSEPKEGLRDPLSSAGFPGLQQHVRSMARTQKAIHEAVARVAMPSTVWLDRLRAQIEASRQSIIEPALRVSAFVRDAVREALPANWQGMSSDEFHEVIELAKTGAVTLVWVPRREVAIELAAATTQADREQVLLAHRDEILEDVAAALGDSKISRLSEQDEARDQAREALNAARAGLDQAAQSLFASVLGHVLEGSLGFERPGKAFKAFKSKDLDAAAISQLRVVCLQLATVNSLTDTDQSPDGFNRHGTQHGNPAYFSEASMLGSALLVASWIRELSWSAEHRLDVFEITQPWLRHRHG